MLNQQIIVDTQAHLAERRANIVNIAFGNPVERQFSFLQIRNGAPQQAWYLVRWGDHVEAQFLEVSGNSSSDATENDVCKQ